MQQASNEIKLERLSYVDLNSSQPFNLAAKFGYFSQTASPAVASCTKLYLAGLICVLLAAPIVAVEALNKERPLRDIVVVVPEAWQPSLSKWEDFRRGQGHRIHVVSPAATAELTREAIKNVAEQYGSQVDVVVLAADAPDYQLNQTDRTQQDTIPTFYIDSKVVVNFGSTPTIATDHPYSDWRQDGSHRTIVGRIPAKNVQALKDYCDRVIQYDTAHDFNGSQRQIDIVAGVGGFGALTDTVVESVARQLLSEDIPLEYQLSMMQASPSSVYYPNPLLFSKTAVERINRGSLLWIYLGHGFVNTLDMIPHEGRMLPILNNDQLGQINVKGLPPLAIFLACYLGAFDAKDGCLAEKMIMQPGGPIAAIAGSRVTMPYGMGILGGGMLEATFRDQRSTIGEILTCAKDNCIMEIESPADEKQIAALKPTSKPSRREFLDTLATTLSPSGHDIALEREEHCYLFNLLGDPLLKISRPSDINVDAPESIRQGEVLLISGTTQTAGRCEIEIVYPRKRIPDPAKKLRTAIQKATSDKLDLQQQLFDAANTSVITRKLIPSIQDSFEAKFDTNNIPTGQLEVRVSVYGDRGWGVKTKPIEIKK
ncbi:MAG: C25 family cysteine peptidase [Planctomycetota bacterium]|nr:C25 family cysteine peptidase [Planctomycetota bacterium]